MKPLLALSTPDAKTETYISDHGDWHGNQPNGRAVNITFTENVYKAIYYDVSIVDPDSSTTISEMQFNNKDEAMAFAESCLS